MLLFLMINEASSRAVLIQRSADNVDKSNQIISCRDGLDSISGLEFQVLLYSQYLTAFLA